MKSILIAAVLVFTSLTATAQIHIVTDKNLKCRTDLITKDKDIPSSKKGGGGDAFPWSLATPFPWEDIHGVWQAYDQSHISFKFKVVRSTDDMKQLTVEMINIRKKTNQRTKGVGMIMNSEPNVIRMIVEDTLIKIALFNSLDIQALPSCGEKVLAASSYKLSCEDELHCDDENADEFEQELKTALLLKKVSNDLRVKAK